MNVLHINQSDIAGGAAIASYQLHQGLLAQGTPSRLLVGRKVIVSDNKIDELPPRNFLGRRTARLTRALGLSYIDILNFQNFYDHPFYQQADILNFHNLHGGYFNYLLIPQFTRAKPVVFTLHDMWSFTGHCAYSYDCDRWKTGCGQCPYMSTYPAITQDNSHLEWQLKDWIYSRSQLFIVTLSNWLTQQVQQSILKRFPIYQIPNGIDTKAYQPIDRQLCRTALNISPHKKVLMCGASNFSDPRKGGDLLIQALQKLPASLKADIVLLTLGQDSRPIAKQAEIETVELGYVSSDRLKSIAYSAADLFLLPTRADNLPLMLQESMACGTPMISFKVGGVPDLVRHHVTGYLAEPYNTQDFADGIEQLLTDEDWRAQLSQNCRTIALQEYSLEHQAAKYINLYQQVLHHWESR